MTEELMPAKGVHWMPIPHWAPQLLRDNGADTATRAGFLEFWDARDHKTGIARLSRDELAERLGVSPSTAKRVTRRLEAWGLIRREDKATGGKGVWAGYYVALDGPHVFPFRVNAYAPVRTVRGPRPAAAKPGHDGAAKPGHDTRPLVPSALPELVDNPVTPALKGVTGDRVSTPKGVTGDRVSVQRGSRVTDTRHLEEELEATADRARTAEGGGTDVPDAAAADGKRTNKPGHEPPADPFTRELQTALGRDWIALAELVAEFGAAGVLPISAEADRLTRQSFDAGWTAAAMVELFGQRLARANATNDAGYVMAILRNMPEPTTPAVSTLPAWCGRCVVRGRWLPDENGYASTVHCPDCWKDAETAEIPATRPQRPSDAVTGMAEGFFAGLPRQGVLDPIDGRTHELAATGSEG